MQVKINAGMNTPNYDRKRVAIIENHLKKTKTVEQVEKDISSLLVE